MPPRKKIKKSQRKAKHSQKQAKFEEHLSSLRLKNLLLSLSPDDALITAVLSGSLKDATILLKNGANPRLMIEDPSSAVPQQYPVIYLAAQKGYQPIVDCLLNYDADAVADIKRIDGLTPLHLSKQNKALRLQQLKTTVELNPDMNQCMDEEKNTPLILAVKLGEYDLALSYVEKGANILLEDIYGNDALSLCSDEVANRLLNALHKPNKFKIKASHLQPLAGSKEQRGNTVEANISTSGFMAISEHDKETPLQPIEAVSSPNRPSNKSSHFFSPENPLPKIFFANELTPQAIFLAIANKDYEKLQWLIEKGMDVNIGVPDSAKTPLHVAVEYNNEIMVVILLKAKADVNAMTRRKMTPLHVAAQNGSAGIIDTLLDGGANIDAASDVGCTPLHEAAAKGHQDTVIALVTRNANPNLREYQFNLTAAQLANTLNQPHITRILNPESIKTLIREKYKPAIAFIQTAFGEKYNQTVTWEIYGSKNSHYAKVSRNFSFEKDATLYMKKLHAIALMEAFIKQDEIGWTLIVPNLDNVLSHCKIQPPVDKTPRY